MFFLLESNIKVEKCPKFNDNIWNYFIIEISFLFDRVELKIYSVNFKNLPPLKSFRPRDVPNVPIGKYGPENRGSQSDWFAYWFFFLVQWETFLTVVRFFWQKFQGLATMLWNCYLCFCPDQGKKMWNAGQTIWICQTSPGQKLSKMGTENMAIAIK
jgi:hypothetical protein